jgi:hypothetical protein
MKKFNLFILTLLLFSFFATSCKKDKDDDKIPEQKYYMYIDNSEQFTISSVLVQGFKSTDPSEENYYIIRLFGSSSTKSLAISLVIFFPYGQNITGNYTLINTQGRYLDEWLSSVLLTNLNGTEIFDSNDLTQGNFNVTRNSTTNFTLSFSITPDDGKVYSGDYTGEAIVQEVNMF